MNSRMNRYRRDYSCSCNSEEAYKSVPCNSPEHNSGLEAIKKRLQKIEFALVDTILYLDAYPESKAAMAHYKKLLAERDGLLSKLNAAGSPMTPMSNYSDEWKWTDSPWPWEYEANV